MSISDINSINTKSIRVNCKFYWSVLAISLYLCSFLWMVSGCGGWYFHLYDFTLFICVPIMSEIFGMEYFKFFTQYEIRQILDSISEDFHDSATCDIPLHLFVYPFFAPDWGKAPNSIIIAFVSRFLLPSFVVVKGENFVFSINFHPFFRVFENFHSRKRAFAK